MTTANPRAWLDGFVRERHGSMQPDGRPLYAWRCTDAEYEALRALMAAQFTAVDRHGHFVERGAEALLCLYAAEAWRRTHEAGAWKWQIVLDQAGVAPGWYRRHYVALTGAIGIGLDYWQRSLLVLNGTHEYLLTVACEGGLPLRLLEREGTRLRAYFLTLQDEARRLRLEDEAALAGLAQRLGDRLPPSLRQPVVFQLAGRLVAAVEDLQRRVGTAADPLGRLDTSYPAWRDALPLTLADGPLRALLGELLARPAAAPGSALRWTCLLAAGNERGRTLVRRLILPPTVSGDTLKDWLQSGDCPADAANLLPRYRLLIERGDDTTPLALATRLGGSGEPAAWRLELTVRVPECCGHAAGGRMPGVSLLAGGRCSLPVGGGEELSELPWVFTAAGDEEEAVWLGAGSVRVRDPSVWVAMPDGFSYAGDVQEGALRLDAPPRKLLYLTGELHWRSPDGETGRVRCAEPQAVREDFRLCGPTLADARNPRPVYLGLPRLQRSESDGAWAFVAGVLEWRLPGEPGWRRDPAGGCGRLQLRWRDTDGETRWRTTIDVLPAATTLRYAGNTVWLEGLGTGWQAQPEPIAGAEVHAEATGAALACRCAVAPGDLPPLEFAVDLDRDGAGSLRLALPFPLQGGAFTYLGAVQSRGATIPVGRLGAATLEVQGGASGGRFVLEAALHDRDPDRDADLARLLWLRRDILLGTAYRTRLNLAELAEAIERLFGASDSLDANVQLRLLGAGSQELAVLQIARFGLRLVPDDARHSVQLVSDAGDGQAPVEAGLAQRLVLEALPLWAPQREVVTLNAVQPGVWLVADVLTEAGPWLLIARDGGWCCARTLLWTVHSETLPTTEAAVPAAESGAGAGAFAAAVLSPRSERAVHYAALYAAMAGDPAHAVWPAIEALFALARELPPSTFDACCYLVDAPAALVTALLRATDASFDAVWSLADALPFDWTLLPLADWHTAAGACHARYAALAGTPLADTLLGDFCTRLAARGPVAEVIADWLRRELLAQTCTGSCLAMAALPQGPAMLRHLIDEERQRLRRDRLDADWPQGPRVLEAVGQYRLPVERRYADEQERRSVLCAPFVGIALTCGGHAPSPALRHELRRLRDFDADWFDRACAMTLCLELAVFHPARPDATA